MSKTSTLYDAIEEQSLSAVCDITPNNSRFAFYNSVAVDHIETLKSGSIPVICNENTFYGVLSMYDLAKAVMRAENRGYKLERFRFTKLRTKTACTEVLRPLTPHCSNWRVMEMFAAGARRLHLVEDNKVVGCLDCVDYCTALCEKFDGIVDKLKVKDIMGHYHTGGAILVPGSKAYVQTLMQFELERRFALLHAAGRIKRRLSMYEIITQMRESAVGDEGDKADSSKHPAFLQIKPTDTDDWNTPCEFYGLPSEMSVSDSLHALREYADYPVIKGEGIERLEVCDLDTSDLLGWIDASRVFKAILKCLRRTKV